MVWLYCQVNFQSAAQLAWNKDSEQLVQNIPHIQLRNSDSESGSNLTLILIIDGFQFSDIGLYQCNAWDDIESVMGARLSLIGTYLY